MGHVEVRPVQHELTVRENEVVSKGRLEIELVLDGLYDRLRGKADDGADGYLFKL